MKVCIVCLTRFNPIFHREFLEILYVVCDWVDGGFILCA
nr:MAG TPA: hypothetical protein [Caudoviricetes sp.]